MASEQVIRRDIAPCARETVDNMSTATPSPEPEATSILPASVASFFTPVNSLLLAALIYLVYRRIAIRSERKLPIPTVAEPIEFKDFTVLELSKYNGKDERILMAVRGKVFDVTAGKQFYGPGGPYRNFAGRDASRGLAKNSFDEDMLTALHLPIDGLEDLTEEEQASLADWERHFSTKYIHVGSLVPNDSTTP